MVARTSFSLFAACLVALACAVATTQADMVRQRTARGLAMHHAGFSNQLSKRASASSIIGKRPTAAFGTTFKLSAGDLFVWQSKTPHDVSETEDVVIVTHGVDRNANDYFKYINDAFMTARSQGLARAVNDKTLRIAPMFFDAEVDAAALNKTTLAWGANNAWCVGEGSTHPKNSDLSSLSVYDELLKKFSNRTNFPKVQTITFVGHGCGAITTQAYAAITPNTNPNGIQVRYVVGNPSHMVYFTKDRPSTTNSKATTLNSTCPDYDQFFYGLTDVYIPYDNPKISRPSALFKDYVSRDVQYLVSLDDDGGGDQTCEARAQGGKARKNRTLSYWKYIHLLAGDSTSSVQSYPGNFDSMKSRATFKGNTIKHTLSQISNIGHSAAAVLGSSQGRRAVFG